MCVCVMCVPLSPQALAVLQGKSRDMVIRELQRSVSTTVCECDCVYV